MTQCRHHPLVTVELQSLRTEQIPLQHLLPGVYFFVFGMIEKEGLAVEDELGHDHAKSKNVLLLRIINRFFLVMTLFNEGQNLRGDIGKSISWRVI